MNSHLFFCFVFSVLAVLHDMWDLSYPTRDRTGVPCIGSRESKPLDLQGRPKTYIFDVIFFFFFFFFSVKERRKKKRAEVTGTRSDY